MRYARSGGRAANYRLPGGQPPGADAAYDAYDGHVQGAACGDNFTRVPREKCAGFFKYEDDRVDDLTYCSIIS